ncbi:MAG TPA: hypothetical protein VKX25_19385 [Bryobacteraceae bacterium]|jgi:hypothetical protein|nr:hypothetical protein [Bryobacteraceae bacterium]
MSFITPRGGWDAPGGNQPGDAQPQQFPKYIYDPAQPARQPSLLNELRSMSTMETARLSFGASVGVATGVAAARLATGLLFTIGFGLFVGWCLWFCFLPFVVIALAAGKIAAPFVWLVIGAPVWGSTIWFVGYLRCQFRRLRQ